VIALAVPSVAYLALWPMLVLLVGAVVLLAVASLLRRPLPVWASTAWVVLCGLGSLVAALIEAAHVNAHGEISTLAGAVQLDGFSAFVAVTVACSVVLAGLVAHDWLAQHPTEATEYQVLALLAASGAVVMGVANDLVVIFLGLEILSIALYVLVAINRGSDRSNEAALKYFILGGFSSAIFIYGVALLYGATGSTNLTKMGRYLAGSIAPHPGLLYAGLALVLVGFCFKVAAVPFHLWTPDVYEGAPTPVTGFMAAVAKAGAFAALLRVLVTALPTAHAVTRPMLYVVALLTLFVGAISAIIQTDLKRLLAYSSINHAGFILLGVLTTSLAGVTASLYYLFTYAILAIGTFGLVAALGRRDDEAHPIAALRGLGHRRPVVAISLAVLLLAQAGAPFTTGFLAKFGVLEAAVLDGQVPLALLALVSATIAAFAYLRVAVLMYASHDAPELADAPSAAWERSEGALLLAEVPVAVEVEADRPVGLATRVAVGISLAVTLFFGVVPGPLLDAAHAAARELLR